MLTWELKLTVPISTEDKSRILVGVGSIKIDYALNKKEYALAFQPSAITQKF